MEHWQERANEIFVYLLCTKPHKTKMKSISLPKIPLLARVILAIGLGIGVGFIAPDWVARISATFNSVFSNFLNFIVPLLILGLVAPGIADLGRSAGRLLLITAGIAYGFTVMAGLFTYFTCNWTFPMLLGDAVGSTMSSSGATTDLTPYFTIEMPPLLGVMSALVAAFTIGLGVSAVGGRIIKGLLDEFRDIISLVIAKVIIPLLPIYIFGIFLLMTSSGEVAGVMGVFAKIIVVIFLMTVVLLLVQYTIAGIITRRNPIKMLIAMLPAYATALGTQSSAATIPVTMAQAVRLGVREDLAGFVVPLCATVHLSGSTLKIVACSVAIMLMQGIYFDPLMMIGFVMMLGVTMVAAPGVPGGAIMAAIGLLGSHLWFDQTAIALMIALYISMDSFGTACNVTGDGAIAVIVNRINRNKVNDEK